MLTVLERMRLTCCVLPQGKALKRSSVIVYEMYRLPNIQLTLMLINLRMRFEQIAFVLKSGIVPQG